MGSFSWTRAENTTARANLTEGDSYKILVPKEFGGGYIKDIYYDYGYVFYNSRSKSKYVDAEGRIYNMEEFGENDLYGILAYWNNCDDIEYNATNRPKTMYEILKYGNTCKQSNRCKGIEIGCYDNQIDELTYPLRLVSAFYKGTYEECRGRSYGDPNQGFGRYYWDNNDYKDYYNIIEGLNK